MPNAMKRSTRFRLIWHGLGLATVLFLPAWIAFSEPFWSVPDLNLLLTVGLGLSYAAGAVKSLSSPRKTRTLTVVFGLAAAAVVAAVTFLVVLMMADPKYSRLLLVTGTVLVVAGLAAPVLLPLGDRLSLGLVAALAVLGGWLLATDSGAVVADAIVSRLPAGIGGRLVGGASGGRRVTTRYIHSSRQTLLATYHRDRLPSADGPPTTGGAVHADPGGKGYLLVRPGGDVFRIWWDEADSLVVRKTRIPRVPLNVSDFQADYGDEVPKQDFRVADLLAFRESDSVWLYVTHHHWHRDGRCFTVRLAGLSLPASEFAGEIPNSRTAWKTLFESRPCLPVKFGTRGVPFAGLQIGGNIEQLGDRRLLVTIGDHQFDGWNADRDLVRDTASDYGKTVVVDLDSGSVVRFTTGHRNPQGLTVDADGRIWSTEHGPQGGDELNLLRRGGDYGWPQRTFGTEYGSVTWPLEESAGNGVGRRSVPPVYAWVPSIGVSDLLAVRDDTFERW